MNSENLSVGAGRSPKLSVANWDRRKTKLRSRRRGTLLTMKVRQVAAATLFSQVAITRSRTLRQSAGSNGGSNSGRVASHEHATLSQGLCMDAGITVFHRDLLHHRTVCPLGKQRNQRTALLAVDCNRRHKR
jgi:hypothetical protein